MAAGVQGNILVVIHGPGRGRSVPTGDVFLSRLRIRQPDLLSRLVFHTTGSPAPSLSGIALVVFWLGDPLRQKYPDCYAEASGIFAAAVRRGIQVINPPAALSNTSKTVQSEIWEHAGIPSARIRCIRTARELPAAFTRLDGPCLLRGDETHAERNVRTLETMADVGSAMRSVALPAALVQIQDIRAEHRAAGVDPQSLYYRFHHKARAFVFRNDVKPSHLFFSRDLVVGLSNSLFTRESNPKRHLARSLGFRRKLFNDLIEADLDYFHSRVPYKDVLVKAVAVLGLDAAAVDYSIRPDGTPILWEANPYFCLPPGEESVLCEERMAIGRVNASLDWMSNCLWAALPDRLAS